MVNSKSAAILLLSVAAIAFYWFVYPTPYLYIQKNGKAYIRVHRYTGTEEVSTAGGWQPITSSKSSAGLTARPSNPMSEPPRKDVGSVRGQDILAGWNSIQFFTKRGSVSSIIVDNPSDYTFDLKIDTPITYFAVDESGAPADQLFTGTGTNSEKILPHSDTPITVSLKGQAGYPQAVLNAIKDGEPVIQRVTLSPASAEAADGSRVAMPSSAKGVRISRTFTPYPLTKATG